MKQRTRLATVLMFCFAMVLSLIGAVFTAFAADVPVGKQIGAPDTAFDSNGWFTQTGAAEVMAANGNDPANILNADPGVYAAGTPDISGIMRPKRSAAIRESQYMRTVKSSTRTSCPSGRRFRLNSSSR